MRAHTTFVWCRWEQVSVANANWTGPRVSKSSCPPPAPTLQQQRTDPLWLSRHRCSWRTRLSPTATKTEKKRPEFYRRNWKRHLRAQKWEVTKKRKLVLLFFLWWDTSKHNNFQKIQKPHHVIVLLLKLNGIKWNEATIHCSSLHLWKLWINLNSSLIG